MRRNWLISLTTASWALLALGCSGRALPGSPGDGAPGGDGVHWGDGLLLGDGAPRPERALPDAATIPAIAFKTVGPGSFLMGSPSSEPCRNSNEVLHPVKLTRAFQIAVSEITQAQYKAVLKDSPAHFAGCGASCPVESVSWSDAAAFANRLSTAFNVERCYACDGQGENYTKPHDCWIRPPFDGSTSKTIADCKGFRLPTEAEWEFAYRAGTQSALYNGGLGSCYKDGKVSAIGWYAGNAGAGPRAVRQKKPNAWGLYDMAGNVWEWTNDWYDASPSSAQAVDPAGPATGSSKVLRGGAWPTSAGSARGAQRNQSVPSKRYDFIGFRVVRSGS